MDQFSISQVSANSLDDVINVMLAHPCGSFVVNLRCKYLHESDWEYLSEPGDFYIPGGIIWLNDWDEGQEDIEYISVVIVEYKGE